MENLILFILLGMMVLFVLLIMIVTITYEDAPTMFCRTLNSDINKKLKS